MIQERPDEEVAFDVVRRVLGVEVEPRDHGGRQGAVDAYLHHSDGHVAALEITSVGDQDEAQILLYLERGGNSRHIEGLANSWCVEVPRHFRPVDLDRVDRALLRCEQHRVRRLELLSDPEYSDVLAQGVVGEVVVLGAGQRARAYVYVEGAGGIVEDGLEPLPDELANQLAEAVPQKRIAKLARTGICERHLFLWARPSAFSVSVFVGLLCNAPLPSNPPRLPDELSCVWLLSATFGSGVVRASAEEGWLRDFLA